jgi:hypothetical protein
VETSFEFEGLTIRVKGWYNLVRPDQKVAADNETFTIWVFLDSLYRDPLVLGTNLAAQPKTIFCLYLDRWPVEQIPLVAKQLLGLERQFVFALASRHRLPELALLAANILTYVAAVLPPLPTGFWDRQPKRTPGRLRRVLAQTGFPEDYPLDGRIRKKQSVTRHLPKGVATRGHTGYLIAAFALLRSSLLKSMCDLSLRLTGAGKPLSRQFQRRRAVKTGPNVNEKLPRAMLWAIPPAPCGRRLAETSVDKI